jgi:hypothetical protein
VGSGSLSPDCLLGIFAPTEFIRASTKPLPPKLRPVRWRNHRPKNLVYVHSAGECLSLWGSEAMRSAPGLEPILHQDDRIVLFRRAAPEERAKRRMLGVDAHGRALSFSDLHKNIDRHA